MKWKRTIFAICAGIISLYLLKVNIQESLYAYMNDTASFNFDAIILEFDKTTKEMLVKVTNRRASPFQEGDKIRTKYVTEYGQIRPRKGLSINIQYWEEDQSEVPDSDDKEVLYIEPDRIFRNAQYIDGEWKPANY